MQVRIPRLLSTTPGFAALAVYIVNLGLRSLQLFRFVRVITMTTGSAFFGFGASLRCARGLHPITRKSRVSGTRGLRRKEDFLFCAFTDPFRFAHPCLKARAGPCPDTCPHGGIRRRSRCGIRNDAMNGVESHPSRIDGEPLVSRAVRDQPRCSLGIYEA